MASSVDDTNAMKINCKGTNKCERSENNNKTTTTPQPFYSPFSGTTRVSRCQKRTSGLYDARADTPTIRPGTTPTRLSSAHIHHPPFFTGRMPFLPPNQQCQSTEGNNNKTSGHSNLTQGHIVARDGWFNRFRQVAPMCPPMRAIGATWLIRWN